MARWGAMMEDTSEDAVGLILAGNDAAPALGQALIDLRKKLGGLRSSLSCGTLSFRLNEQLGASTWLIQGPCKDRALELFKVSGPDLIVVAKKDFPNFQDALECIEIEENPGLKAAGAGLILNVLAPAAEL
jgi:hypothetical protein